MILQKLTAIMVLVFGASIAAPVLAADPDQARQAFKEGIAFFESGNYEQAVSAFRKANDAQPHWKLSYNIGQCEAALKRYGLALEAFEHYLLEGGDDVPLEKSNEVRGEIDKFRDLTGSLEITGPKDAQLFIDDRERGTLPLAGKLSVAGGVHHLRLELEGTVMDERQIKIPTKDTLVIHIESEKPSDEIPDSTPAETNIQEAPPKSRSPLITAGWITGGTGVAVMITGAVTGGLALSNQNKLEDACPDGECSDDKDYDRKMSAQSLALATDILLPLGGALVTTGVVLLIVGHKKRKSEQLVGTISPLISPDGGALMWTRSF